MPAVELLFTPATCVSSAESQPAVTQSLQYVRAQVEASVTEFTTWKTQLLSLGQQHPGENCSIHTTGLCCFCISVHGRCSCETTNVINRVRFES